MKHGIIEKCMISTSTSSAGSSPTNKDWYRFVPRQLKTKELESYIMCRKYILSNYRKLPKSLTQRLQLLCPNCYYLQCSCKNETLAFQTRTCVNCKSDFLSRKNWSWQQLKKFKNFTSLCKACKIKTEQIFNNYIFGRNEKAKQIKYVVDNNIAKYVERFKYRILTQEDRLLFPPAFLWNHNTTLCDLILKNLKLKKAYQAKRFDKKVKFKSNFLDIKPDPFTFIGQGKYNCFRKYLLSKRSYNSSRAVAVPVPELAPNEVILNREVWETLGCPDIVVSVRYPVIDTRAITHHKVKGTWEKPAIGVTPFTTDCKQEDFDGDQENTYVPKRRSSIKECDELINPENSFVAMGEIRVNFTHNQLESLFSFFGTTRNQIHSWLYNLYVLNGSKNAYSTFEDLRKHLELLNSFVKPTVSYHLFSHILSLFLFQQFNFEDFVTVWKTHKFTKNGLFSRYIESNPNRWKYEHLYQMTQYLRGMSKIEYISEAFSCRTALSKSGVEFTGYATHKLSYTLPELWYGGDGMIYYGKDQVAFRNIRRLYTPVPSYDYVRKMSIFHLLKDVSFVDDKQSSSV